MVLQTIRQAKVSSPSLKKNEGKKHLDTRLVEKAVAALLKYHERQQEKGKAHKNNDSKKSALFGNDAVVQVQFGLEVAPAKPSSKPIRIPLPHGFYRASKDGNEADDDDDDDDGLEEAEVCLIVKEESKKSVQEMISHHPEHMGCIKKVLGLQSLRKKHNSYQQRRALLEKYDIFMADDRILPMLGKAIGKGFFNTKKQPIPVRLTRHERALPLVIYQCLTASTFMTRPAGTCVTIKIGNTGMRPEKLVANIAATVEAAVPKGIHRQWANVRSVSIKTPESAALPIYNKTPEQLIEIARMAGVEQVWTKDADHFKEEIDGQPQQEESDNDGDEEIRESRKKRELAEAKKSSLVRALKKQKKLEEKESVGDSVKEVKKKKTKQDSAAKNTSNEPEGTTTIVKKSVVKKNAAAKSNDFEDREKKEKKPAAAFIAAKRFKGSKKGYVFKKDKQGLGYYLDVPPVVDKLAMAAFARMRKGGGGSRKKRKGRR